jgi:hypothetical protein
VTFYEALKANETNRVTFDDEHPWHIGQLIKFLNENTLQQQDLDIYTKPKWRVVEEPLEFWALVNRDNSIGAEAFESKKKAAFYARDKGCSYVVAMFREVPGTREEVKP